MRRLYTLTAALAAAALLTACSPSTTQQDPTPTAASPTNSEDASAAPSPTTTAKSSQLSIVSSGDILPHLSVNYYAQQAAGGVLDYGPLFEQIAPWIDGRIWRCAPSKYRSLLPGRNPRIIPRSALPQSSPPPCRKWDGMVAQRPRTIPWIAALAGLPPHWTR